MDSLKAYLKTLADEGEREAFAARCDTSLGHLRNIIYGKTCSAPLASLIERESSLAVRRWEMRPDDWAVIWPELVGADGAPPVAAAPESQAAA